MRAQLNAQQSAFLRTLVQLLPDLRIDLPDVAPKWDAYLKSVPVEGQLPDLPTLASEQERNYLAGRGVLDQYYGIRAVYERLAKYVHHRSLRWRGGERGRGTRHHRDTGHALGRVHRTGVIGTGDRHRCR